MTNWEDAFYEAAFNYRNCSNETALRIYAYLLDVAKHYVADSGKGEAEPENEIMRLCRLYLDDEANKYSAHSVMTRIFGIAIKLAAPQASEEMSTENRGDEPDYLRDTGRSLEEVCGRALNRGEQAECAPRATDKDRARQFVTEVALEMGFAMSDFVQEIILNQFLRHAAPRTDVEKDAARLDWLDARNEKFKMGWRVGIAPVGNVSIQSVVQLSGPIVPIREAIDAAILAAKGTKDA